MAVEKIFPEKVLALKDEACERAVIGALIIESGLYYRISNFLSEGVFTHPRNVALYMAIKQMKDNGEIIDLITLSTYLQKHPAKNVEINPYDIVEIISEVATTVTAEANAANLFDLWQRRQLFNAMYGAIELAFTQFGSRYNSTYSISRLVLMRNSTSVVIPVVSGVLELINNASSSFSTHL